MVGYREDIIWKIFLGDLKIFKIKRILSKIFIIMEKRRKKTKKTEPYKPEEVGECPECGKSLLKRSGRYGEFIGCSGFPKCRFTCSVDELESKLKK